MPPTEPTAIIRFGDFELDLPAYELRRKGRRVKLGRQPMDLLILLAERPRQLVSRTEIVDRLWGADIFVDVETGVNTAISKVRQALRDSADAPAFVERVPGKGYRFIADVQPRPGPDPALAVVAIPDPAPVATRVALAVLPFQNLGSDPERDYLASGLTDETSASLAQIDPAYLSVKGRTARYKGTTKTAAEIGRELGVDYLVESSLRAEGQRLRVTVKLIRARDEEHVWSHSYEREPSSLLGLQQELSAGIAEQIRLRLSPDRATGIGQRQTQSAGAYDAYLRARYQTHRRTPEGNARAIELYKRAIALDPDYALAWSDLAVTFAAGTVNGDADPMVVRPLARDAAMRAVRANPSLSEAQLARGYERWLLEWDWTGAEAGLRMAIDLDPSNGQAFRLLGHVLSQAGRQDEAEGAMRRARELDPTDPLTHGLSSQIASQARHFDQAIDHARRTILLDPQFWIGHTMLGTALDSAGEPELALEALADAARLSNGNSKVVSLRGYVLAKIGRTEAARDVLRDLEARGGQRYMPPYASALVLAGLGDREGVFAALERAFAATDIHLMYLPVDWRWDPYRDDARFAALIARCGFDRGQ